MLLLVLIKTASVCLMVIPISSRRAISFPEVIGIGKLQPYARWNENMPDSGASSDLLELGMNYVISGHNARLNANWRTGDANLTGVAGADVNRFEIGMQLQY